MTPSGAVYAHARELGYNIIHGRSRDPERYMLRGPDTVPVRYEATLVEIAAFLNSGTRA